MRGIVLLGAAVLQPVALPGQTSDPRPDPRSDLAVVARALDTAVARVSHPVGWSLVPEGEGALSYYVAGSGAIFVVAPRAVASSTATPSADGGSAIARVMRVVEDTLQQAESPETRDRLQKTLDGLRRQQQELAVRAVAQERDRASLQKLATDRLARRARELASGVEPDAGQRVKDAAAAEEALRRFEAEAAAFQRQAESARQAADTALAELAREMRARLAGGEGAGVSEPPLAGPGEPPASLFVPPPPWRGWAPDGSETEHRPAAKVLGEVREAVTSVLEAHVGGLRLLAPQDFMVVTVDFVPQGGLRLRVRPERTLVVRVRKRELQEAGRSRIEYLEY